MTGQGIEGIRHEDGNTLAVVGIDREINKVAINITIGMLIGLRGNIGRDGVYCCNTNKFDARCTMSEGYGPLPIPEELCEQLTEAGYERVRKKRLIPGESFFAFMADKP